jgi:ABC-type amino acid transport substrate-binding protein/cell division protein FtsL
MRTYQYSFAVVLLYLCIPVVAQAAVLAPTQSSWLTKHNNTILVRPEKNYPPFSFSSSSPNSNPKGLAVDYIELVARKVGATAMYVEAKPSGTVLADLKSGKEGVALALSQTDATGAYLYFSEPFVTIPAVIVTRRDYVRGSKELTLGDFTAKQVAVTNGYAVQEYIGNNYPKIIIDTVSDDEVGIQKLLLGEVDAAVMDLASLSYYTSHDMLSYVRVAGQTGFQYKLSFAVPKTMPDLAVILNAGLKEVTPAERTLIQDRWITFPTKEDTSRETPFSFMKDSLWAVLSISGAIVIAILLTLMVVHTRRHHRLQIAALSRAREKEKTVVKLTDELKELEEASGVLHENIEEIQEKIKHIND